MHFFYVDESGDSGANLTDRHQPIIVLGGISVRDEGWNTTQERMREILSDCFGGNIPANFELHCKELLCPNGEGPFNGHTMQARCGLALRLLRLLSVRAHDAHYIALDKAQLAATSLTLPLPYSSNQPYLIGFDYLITYINWFVRKRLGVSERGMIILDKKEQYHQAIEQLMHERRFGGPAANRVKWVVEFSYSVDSKKNPMLQLSDVVIYCVKRFIEVEKGHRNNWSQETRNFYARCYALIRDRVARARRVERTGRNMDQLNTFLTTVRAEPRLQWRRQYELGEG
jgi:hypothetical protein